jgi:hypothetical protein
MTDYSFTLQAVMELQKTVGGLTSNVAALQRDSEKQGDKLNKISHQIASARTALVIIGIALSGMIGILSFVANKLADVVIKHWGG